ncbi:LSU ribosomal protein L15P [Methanocella conradii HZ254]|uniref:Large ribosomal subunit protein uL15 n=1 Tax=Methanocella conradii (strain DSM 24694 / JCM 17849 / CGMCC 1.5162 / HZ254) TaxID=1041930 RepID=H8IAK2_METCZ|nr:uL15 family ribosomal protein [Methanocella conradii]AFD00099.1 LSU ribosomal protein L15P [Methanocella conradii HZ254]
MTKQKCHSYRGSRTCGGGTHKNRRGGGSRGGRGHAGACKHNTFKAMKEGWMFGKHGFHRPPSCKEYISTLNVGELDELSSSLLEMGLATEKDGAISVDLGELGFDKLLGDGRVTRKYVVSVATASASARAKIEELGGQIISETETA